MRLLHPQSIWKTAIATAVSFTLAACASSSPHGTWLWNNQTLPEQVGLDDSVFVAMVNRLPGVKLDSVFHMLSEIGYGPTRLYSGPSRMLDNFGVKGIEYCYKDSCRREWLLVYVYSDKYLFMDADWEDILSNHVKQIDIQHFRFNDSQNSADSTNQRKPREKTGYRVTHDSRTWYGPHDLFR